MGLGLSEETNRSISEVTLQNSRFLTYKHEFYIQFFLHLIHYKQEVWKQALSKEQVELYKSNFRLSIVLGDLEKQ